MTDIAYFTATDLLDAVSKKLLSPVEIMKATIDRIERRNPKLNALTFFDFEHAMREAQKAEKRLIRGEVTGPAHGLPTLMKDLFDFRPGWPTTFGGIPSLRNNIATSYCNYAKTVEAAGAILVGKTNSPVMGFRATCDNPTFGPTRNPFDFAMNSGGSSGGSAAAVADGLVPFAEGTDGGGSIRIPAAWCNTFGFQPSFGRVPFVARPNAFGNSVPFLYEGVITRSVRDAALLINIMSRFDLNDPFSISSPQLMIESKNPSDFRICASVDYGTFPIDSDIRKMFERRLQELERSGFQIEVLEESLPMSHEDSTSLWFRQIMLNSIGTLDDLREQAIDLLAENAGSIPQIFLHHYEAALALTSSQLQRDLRLRTQIFDYFNHIFERCDIFLTPTVASLPVPNAQKAGDTFGPAEIEGKAVDPSIGWCLTYFTNFTGHAAASAPLGLIRGLPCGLHIMGRRNGDADVMNFAKLYEELFPWADQYASTESN